MSVNLPVQLAMLVLLALVLFCGVDRTHCLTVRGNEADKLTLLEFKNTIKNDPTGALSTWNTTTTPYCQWNGVICSLKHPGRVTALELGGHGLSGPISASLGNLTFLKILNLSTNYLLGELPPFNRLQKLQYLVLSRNLLQGSIPDSLTNCSNLEYLDLGGNFLKGVIPFNIGILSNLKFIQFASNNLTGMIPTSLKNISQQQPLVINLGDNQLSGSIPDELGQLSNMRGLNLGANMLTGRIPPALCNLSSLIYLDISANKIRMELPSSFGDKLPNLMALTLAQNMFEGKIPPSLGNASKLGTIDLSHNNLIGQIPSSFGNLGSLSYLDLEGNKLEAGDSGSWEFIDTLSQCRLLDTLILSANNLQGALPNTMGNLSSTLTKLYLDINNLSGIVPRSIGNLSGLVRLHLANNNLNGTIEEWIGKLQNLQDLALDTNNLSGSIPSSIGDLAGLVSLSLGRNRFEGPILPSLGNLSLSMLNLSYNNLHGSIPKEVFRSGSTMSKCVLSYNNLEGSIPSEIGGLQQLTELQLSSNKLTGEVPDTLGSCPGLLVLQIDSNFLSGNIPRSLGNLKSLTLLNLSHNNLSGFIPAELSRLQSLTQLDLSYNHLKGKIPTIGVFGNAASVSLVGNQGLCGGVPDLHMPSCPNMSQGKQIQYYLVRVLIPIFGFMSLVVLAYFLVTETKMARRAHSSASPFGEKFLKVSYSDLAEATKNFSESNLIGRGSYGSVYKGKLMEEKLEVAVKVLDLDMRGAEKSFVSECEALRSIQHRSLVPIITACSTVDIRGNLFKALIYEFMPNGNLDTWLHHKEDGKGSRRLSLTQRINIVVNIADALDYLHNDSGRPIIHCDVKPSNILLDDDMNAHLGDFGISSFYIHSSSTGYSNTSSSIGVKGTIGYIAPEYAGGARPSTCGDAYSFGILLLEMLTGRRPTDPMFENGLNIINFVERSFPDQILEVIDVTLQDEFKTVTQENTMAERKVYRCLVSLLEVALPCTGQFPSERMTMREAASKMRAIQEFHATGKVKNDSPK